jgi:hypothetical protein
LTPFLPAIDEPFRPGILEARRPIGRSPHDAAHGHDRRRPARHHGPREDTLGHGHILPCTAAVAPGPPKCPRPNRVGGRPEPRLRREHRAGPLVPCPERLRPLGANIKQCPRLPPWKRASQMGGPSDMAMHSRMGQAFAHASGRIWVAPNYDSASVHHRPRSILEGICVGHPYQFGGSGDKSSRSRRLFLRSGTTQIRWEAFANATPIRERPPPFVNASAAF